MSQTICITGNCHVGGISSALSLLLPDATVVKVAEWELNNAEQVAQAVESIDSASVWVQMPMPFNEHLAHLARQESVLRIPSVTFAAFQPDNVYASTSDGAVFHGFGDYHSAIALWAWKRGMDAEHAAQLFSTSVFNRLGYMKYWQPAASSLQHAFDESDLRFNDFWLRAKRLGTFMHTMNHPRIDALALVAKGIATTLGESESVWRDPVERYLPDWLNHMVWPVYPPIARVLGVEGSYRWRRQETYHHDLASWLDSMWQAYSGHDPEMVHCGRLTSGLYDQVLHDEARHGGIHR